MNDDELVLDSTDPRFERLLEFFEGGELAPEDADLRSEHPTVVLFEAFCEDRGQVKVQLAAKRLLQSTPPLPIPVLKAIQLSLEILANWSICDRHAWTSTVWSFKEELKKQNPEDKQAALSAWLSENQEQIKFGSGDVSDRLFVTKLWRASVCELFQQRAHDVVQWLLSLPELPTVSKIEWRVLLVDCQLASIERGDQTERENRFKVALLDLETHINSIGFDTVHAPDSTSAKMRRGRVAGKSILQVTEDEAWPWKEETKVFKEVRANLSKRTGAAERTVESWFIGNDQKANDLEYDKEKTLKMLRIGGRIKPAPSSSRIKGARNKPAQ